jgi:hypothetical protein
VVVLDRNHSPGVGGVLAQELRAALYGRADMPARVHGVLSGVGGLNVPVDRGWWRWRKEARDAEPISTPTARSG